MHVNGKIRPDENIPGIREGEIKGDDGGAKSDCDKL
jgi:hypothetical protein